MSRIPYPGILNTQERANLESVERVSALDFIYFTFSVSRLKRSIILKRLPKGSMVYGPVFNNTEEPFDGTNILINIGTDEAIDNIMIMPIQVSGTSTIVQYGIKFLVPFKIETDIRMTITYTTKPIRGRGWGIIQWLNLNLVEGF